MKDDIKKRIRIKYTYEDVKDLAFLNFQQLMAYLPGIGSDKLLRFCRNGVFQDIDGLYARAEVDERMTHLSDFSDHIGSRRDITSVYDDPSPTALKYQQAVSNFK